MFNQEARATKYWMRLSIDTNYLTKEQQESLVTDIEELLRIIGSIQKQSVIRN